MGQDQPQGWPPGQYPAGGPWTDPAAAQTPVPPAPAPPTSVPNPRGEQAWAGDVTVPGGAQQWPPVPPPYQPPNQPPPGTGNRALVLSIVFAVVVLLAGGGVGWWLWTRPAKPAPVGPVASSGPVSTASQGSHAANGTLAGGASAPRTTPASTPPPPDPQAQALAQLTQLRQQSLPRLTLDGRWVAQVASKSVGITDPLQTAQNGTHTFYASDILAESLAARNLVDDPSEVYVLWGTDFGKRSQAPDGSPYWVTIVDAGFAGHDNVLEWCQVSFPTLNPQQLADTCAPRQLTPPHN